MRLSPKNKAYCVVLYLLLATAPLFAQVKAYKYRAALPKTDSSAVYKIHIKPALLAKSAVNGFYDIRLVDENSKETAFALMNGTAAQPGMQFTRFPRVPGAQADSVFTCENNQGLNISQLVVQLKNTGVSRTVNLSGSDDTVHWFAIEEDVPLQQASPSDSTNYRQAINMPLSNYRYFRLTVNGKSKGLVNILQAGVYSGNAGHPGYDTLAAPRFSVKRKNASSSVFVYFDGDYQVDKIHINITSPKYYNRQLSVYSIKNGHSELVCSTSISSAATQDISLNVKTSALQIDIENGDDSPLTISSIAGYEIVQHMYSYLEAGHQYAILTADTAAKAPQYDLSFLTANTIHSAPVLNHAEIVINPAYFQASPKKVTNFTVLLWLAIAIGLALLSFLTWRMVREINTRQP